jgi:hypothetical protein
MIEWKKRRYCNFEEEKDLRAFCRKFALEAALNPSQMRSEWKPCGVYTEQPLDLKDLFVYGLLAPSGPEHPHYRGFTITLRHTTLGRTPLDE